MTPPVRRFQYLTATHGPAVLEGLREDRTIAAKPATESDAMARLAACDPTADDRDNPARYLTWLCNVYRRGWIEVKGQEKDHAMLAEDFPRIRTYLSEFDRAKHRLPQAQRDIGRMSYEDLKAIVIRLRDRVQDIPVPPEIVEQSTILYNGAAGIVVVPHTTAASCAWGRGTEWCTAYTKTADYFNDYNAKGTLVILRTESGEKYQIHGLSVLRNDRDNPVADISEDLRALLDALPDTLQSGLSRHSWTDLFNGLYPPSPMPRRRRRQADDISAVSEGDDEAARNYVLGRVRDHPNVIANVSPKLRNDRAFLLELVAITPEVLEFVPVDIRKDRLFMLDAIQIDGRCIYFADRDIRKNGGFIMEAVTRNIRVWESLDQYDRGIIADDILQQGFRNTIGRHWNALSYVDDIGIELTPREELEIFERALSDQKMPLTPRRLHLFPGLRENGAFMTLGVEDAHAVLIARYAPAPRVERGPSISFV